MEKEEPKPPEIHTVLPRTSPRRRGATVYDGLWIEVLELDDDEPDEPPTKMLGVR